MTLADAIRLTEILLGIAFLQQSFEHLALRHDRLLFPPRIVLSMCLILGFQTPWACVGLVVLALLILKRFQGPYNGGSDRMGLLILCCLCLAEFLPRLQLQEYAFGYMAAQVILSYFMAGFVKIINPDWRSGRALQDVFLFSVYPVSQSLRSLANDPRLLCAGSWGVISFELLFPLVLLSHITLIAALGIAFVFHMANACLFGLNRFVWTWCAAYPSIIWLAARLTGAH